MIKRKFFLQLLVVLVTLECCCGENVDAGGFRRRIKKRKKPEADGTTIKESVDVEKNEAETKHIPSINVDDKLVARQSVIKKRKKKPEVTHDQVYTEKKVEEIQHAPVVYVEDKLVAKKFGINKRKKRPEVTQRENVATKENEEEIKHVHSVNQEDKLVAKESVIKKRKKRPGVVVRDNTEAKAKKEGIKYIPLLDPYLSSESVQSEEIVKVGLPEVEKEEMAEVDKKEVADIENEEVPENEKKQVADFENEEVPEKEKKEEKVVKVEKIKKEVAKVTVVQKVEQEQVKEEVDDTPKERIVTEWMLFRTGVPVDYSYSENATNPGDIVSVPGCPKSVDGYPWVLYGKPEPKCYLVGQRSSVCQGSAMMNYQRGSEYGVCACNFQECLEKRGLPSTTTSEGELLTNANLLRRRNGVPGKLRYRFCRPMGVTCEEFVYDQKEKRCDIMYSQGPCKEGEWLQRNSKGGVECAPRLCEGEGGLTEKSETFQRSYGNVTKDNAECCRPWGGFAVASIITSLNKLSSCDAGQVYSKTLNKCITPFRSSGLTVG